MREDPVFVGAAARFAPDERLAYVYARRALSRRKKNKTARRVARVLAIVVRDASAAPHARARVSLKHGKRAHYHLGRKTSDRVDDEHVAGGSCMGNGWTYFGRDLGKNGVAGIRRWRFGRSRSVSGDRAWRSGCDADVLVHEKYSSLAPSKDGSWTPFVTESRSEWAFGGRRAEEPKREIRNVVFLDAAALASRFQPPSARIDCHAVGCASRPPA